MGEAAAPAVRGDGRHRRVPRPRPPVLAPGAGRHRVPAVRAARRRSRRHHGRLGGVRLRRRAARVERPPAPQRLAGAHPGGVRARRRARRLGCGRQEQGAGRGERLRGRQLRAAADGRARAAAGARRGHGGAALRCAAGGGPGAVVRGGLAGHGGGGAGVRRGGPGGAGGGGRGVVARGAQQIGREIGRGTQQEERRHGAAAGGEAGQRRLTEGWHCVNVAASPAPLLSPRAGELWRLHRTCCCHDGMA
mmetsp:Transcript_41439/g.99165  ORF Transcript_41439/g.99165 Transcript_41439/m.99165 type:complete len:249 (-) Transcript_41439:181-927(-)